MQEYSTDVLQSSENKMNLQVSTKSLSPELQKYIKRMGKKAKIELINQLQEEVDVDSDSHLKTQSIQEYWNDFAAGKLTAVVWYQRLYLFFDQTDGDGHEWQRGIMASMIKSEPLPLFWINQKSLTKLHIIDGGHRSRTIDAWFRNCIRLPERTFVKMPIKGVKVNMNLGGLNWFEIQEQYPEFALEWATTYMIHSRIYRNYSDAESAGLFFRLNNGNSMSAAEDRNSIVSKLSDYCREKADFASDKALKMFQEKNLIYNNKTGTWSSEYHNIKLAKRGFDGFVTKVCFLVLKDYMTSVSENKLKTWYGKEYNKTLDKKETDYKKFKSKFDKVLKWVDDLIMSETVKKGRLWQNEIIFLLHIKNYWESKYQLTLNDKSQFLKSYRKVLKIFRDDSKKSKRKYELRNKKLELTTISKVISSMSTCSEEELRVWIPMFADVMKKTLHEPFQKAIESGNKDDIKKLNCGFKLLDKKRSFTDSQKESAEVEQNWECKYHYYCGNLVGEGNSSVGDHSDNVHTNYGSTSDENLGVTCESCNSEKGSLSHKEFTKVIEMRMES